MGGLLLGRPPTASAAPARAVPRRYTRAEWSARPPKAAATVLNRAPDHIVVHHTASANATDLSLEHAFTLSRAIQNFHMDTNGWEDAGQQLTISRGGHLMEGRNRSLAAIGAGDLVVGAQTLGHNDHTIGIENEGTYMTEEPTAALWDALVATCAWLCGVHGLDPHAAIVGHRDYNTTACPGDALYALLPRLRNEVAGDLGMRRRVREAPPPEPSGLPGPRFTFDHGPAA
ncbi:N-acetylmuramoyl-L-alanine amidase [Actinomadura sp. KC216]|uniref:peptidoglycan recognition protein family protein n=1 Tax=Actinomadura sp. KC216 TaxID=2530370 RepID=UPI00104A3A5D|nr:peptidoglycan recognition family protein [Actinomadura sp. KC216]TDB88520.1 N-acetylmuramoyl-L-alanine amidase [Actinomadura sp. KC216]